MKFVRGRRCVNNIEFPFPPSHFPIVTSPASVLRNCVGFTESLFHTLKMRGMSLCVLWGSWVGVAPGGCVVKLSPTWLRIPEISTFTSWDVSSPSAGYRIFVVINMDRGEAPRLNVGRRGSFCCNLFRGYAILVTLQQSKSTTTNLLKPACGWWWYL